MEGGKKGWDKKLETSRELDTIRAVADGKHHKSYANADRPTTLDRRETR